MAWILTNQTLMSLSYANTLEWSSKSQILSLNQYMIILLTDFVFRIINKKEILDQVVEECLRSAALWDEVKDRLQESALGMSGGQQQGCV